MAIHFLEQAKRPSSSLSLTTAEVALLSIGKAGGGRRPSSHFRRRKDVAIDLLSSSFFLGYRCVLNYLLRHAFKDFMGDYFDDCVATLTTEYSVKHVVE